MDADCPPIVTNYYSEGFSLTSKEGFRYCASVWAPLTKHALAGDSGEQRPSCARWGPGDTAGHPQRLRGPGRPGSILHVAGRSRPRRHPHSKPRSRRSKSLSGWPHIRFGPFAHNSANPRWIIEVPNFQYPWARAASCVYGLQPRPMIDYVSPHGSCGENSLKQPCRGHRPEAVRRALIPPAGLGLAQHDTSFRSDFVQC
jgi:hypothetical protein